MAAQPRSRIRDGAPNGIWTLQQPEVAVRAWADLLRPHGRVIVIDGLWKPVSVAGRLLAAAGHLLGQLRGGPHHDDHSYPAAAYGQLPLRNLTSLEPARNVFLRAGLTGVLAEELTWIDNLERSLMSLDQRLRNHWRPSCSKAAAPPEQCRRSVPDGKAVCRITTGLSIC